MSQYSILIIPENHLESKRFRLPKIAVHFGLVLFVLALSFTTFMTWGFLHYRQVARQTAMTTLSPGEELYRTQLASKVNNLEEALKRTQQFATRVESMLDVESGKVKVGVGPLSDQDDFSKYLEQISRLPKPSKMTFLNSENGAQPEGFYNQLGGKLEELSEYALSLEARVNEVYELSQDKLSYWASTPSIWPVKGWVTSDFGGRPSPFSGAPKFHEGIDIAAPYGSPIYAPSDGIASFTGSKGGYGNALILDHGYGITTLYGHTSHISVKEGEKVKRGELIASVGNTGASTGPHLHYEVHVDGIPTDPMKFVLK